MNNKILQYALFKSISDDKNNLLECFYPFFILALDPSHGNPSIAVQKNTKDSHGLEIPIHVLHRLARLGRDKRHIELESTRTVWPILLTDSGRRYRSSIDDYRETERRISSFIDGFVSYLDSLGISATHEETRENVENYIKKNTTYLSGVIFHDSSENLSKFEKHEKEFTKYIIEIEKAKPDDYQILKELFYGSIICSSLLLSEKEFSGVVESNFKNTKIYFDANYLFSFLNFHDEELSVPANELYQLLMNFGFELRYFDFTLEEMTIVLKNYVKRQHIYASGIKVKSLYSMLRSRNTYPSDIIDIISNLEANLAKFSIFKKNTDVELTSYKPGDSQLFAELRKSKRNQGILYQNHDIALLEKARKIRKKSYQNFENTNSFIITSDFKLGMICYRYFGHEKSGTVSEVILDRTMTNILFLKNPSIELSLSTIITGFTNNLFVARSIWDKFYTIAKTLIASGEVPEDKLSNLFYHGYIESELLQFGDTDLDSIDEQFVLERIEDVVALIEKEEVRKIAEVEVKYRSIIETKEEEARRRLQEKEVEAHFKIQAKAGKDSHRITVALRVVVGLLAALPLVLAILKIMDIGNFDLSILSIILYAFFVINTSVASIGKIWERIERTIFLRQTKKLESELL